MKSFLKKRWHGIPIGILAALILAGTALGVIYVYVYTADVPGTVEVIEATEEIIGLEVTPTTLDFGQVYIGGQGELDLNVKNVGNTTHTMWLEFDNVPIGLYVSPSDFDTSNQKSGTEPGTIMISYSHPSKWEVAPGETYTFHLILTVSSTTNLGVYDFDLTVW